MPDERITVKVDKTEWFDSVIRHLANVKLMVGIPSDDEQPHYQAKGSEERTDTPKIGNAALGYIHEYGSPINNIPPRPFLVPGVSGSRDRWGRYLNQAAKLAFDGNMSAVDRALHAAGTTAVSAVKAVIQSKQLKPLSARTIAARRRRSKGSSYRRKATTAVDVTPLLDTGQLINSISYVLRKK